MDLKTFNRMSLDEQLKLAIHSKDPSVLDIIARSNNDAAQIFAARNKHTSSESLDLIALTTKSKTVVDSLLGNINLLPSTRQMLSKAC